MKRELALEDDSYRDRLAKATGGKRSCAKMTMAELEAVKSDFMSLGAGRKRKSPPKRAGARRMATGGQASKIRALWLSLYHLAEVEDPAESALAAFVMRTTAIEALDWLGPADADKTIRALRGWCERVGFKEPVAERVAEIDSQRAQARLPPAGHAFATKVSLIELQWHRMLDAGATPISQGDRVWMRRFDVSAAHLLSGSADIVIERLGAMLRQRKTEAGDG